MRGDRVHRRRERVAATRLRRSRSASPRRPVKVYYLRPFPLVGIQTMTRSAHILLWLSVVAMWGCANLPSSSEPVEPSSEQAQTPIAELPCEELKLALTAVRTAATKGKLLAKMKADTTRRASGASYRHSETAGSTIAAVHAPPAYPGSKPETRREQVALKREFAARCEPGFYREQPAERREGAR